MYSIITWDLRSSTSWFLFIDIISEFHLHFIKRLSRDLLLIPKYDQGFQILALLPLNEEFPGFL